MNFVIGSSDLFHRRKLFSSPNKMTNGSTEAPVCLHDDCKVVVGIGLTADDVKHQQVIANLNRINNPDAAVVLYESCI